MWLPRNNAIRVTLIPNAHLALRQELQTNSSYNVVPTMRSALGDSTYVRRVQPDGHSLVRSVKKKNSTSESTNVDIAISMPTRKINFRGSLPVTRRLLTPTRCFSRHLDVSREWDYLYLHLRHRYTIHIRSR